MKSKLLSFLGTAMICLSLIGLGITFYPVMKMYLFPPILKTVPQKGIFITIPKIHAQAPIILNVDPWNEAVYKKALTRGVAHAKGTVLPGQKGTTYLFAHSSGMPWEITRFNTVFLRLPELVQGDKITITTNGKQHVYEVRNKKEILPTDVSYLLHSKSNTLILQTCTPIGTSLRRLLIFATPV